MVASIDDVTFSTFASLKRSNSIPHEQLKAAGEEFQAAYLHATGENMANASPQVLLAYTLTVMRFLGRPCLYDNGIFQPKRASRYAARLGSLDKDTLTHWQVALEKIAGESIETGPLAFALLKVEPLFTEASVTPATSERMLSRLNSLGASPISQWRKALGESDIDATFAALSLMNADGLFVGDRFQESVFAKALPIAERLIQEVKNKAQ
ncbi:MAG TPA: hypothetical protein VGM86_33495 [Thermoanaerobaculia bacterium]|jgi:hypothetical protein